MYCGAFLVSWYGVDRKIDFIPMSSVMKYRLGPVVFLLILTAFVANSEAQIFDSLIVSQKTLGPEDLILPVDSFKIKVVAASRSAKQAEDLPVTTYVITHEEIMKNHYMTLVDVLKTLPGIRVSQPGNGELGEIFLLRNLAGNYYTKILVDGMPVKPSVVAGMPIGGQLPVRQAERIEVVFGPAASIYGADAASGVINIITKEADKGTFAAADILFGQNEYSCMNFMIGGKAGKNKNLLNYNFYGSKTDYGNINIGYSLPDSSAELLSGSYMMGMNLTFRGVSVSYNNMYRRTNSSIGSSSRYFRYDDPSAFWGENIQRLTLGYTKPVFRKLTSTSNFSSLSYRMDNNSNQVPTFIPGVNKVYLYAASDDILLEEILTYTPKVNLEILGGASFQVSSNLPKMNYLTEPFPRNTYIPFGHTHFTADTLMGDFGQHTLRFSNSSVFAQVYWIHQNLRLMGGMRYDYNSAYDDSFNPRIALMYRFPKSSIRLSVGSAMKAPPASVSYESLAYPAGTNPDSIVYLVIPNTRLKPEKYWAYELSYSRKLSQKIGLELSFYYNSVTRLINFDATIPVPDTLPLSVNDSVSTKLNDPQAKSILYGAQLTMHWNDIIPAVHLNAAVSLTYNADRRKNFANIDEVFDVFNFAPSHYGQCILSASPAKNLYIQFDNFWMTEWKAEWMQLLTQSELLKDVSGYYTFDFLANYNISGNLTAFIKIYNVLNEKYGTPNIVRSERDMISVPQPGRNIRFGLTYSLN
jgi:outer membrane receptor for ferrienterochelin and colicin